MTERESERQLLEGVELKSVLARCDCDGRHWLIRLAVRDGALGFVARMAIPDYSKARDSVRYSYSSPAWIAFAEWDAEGRFSGFAALRCPTGRDYGWADRGLNDLYRRFQAGEKAPILRRGFPSAIATGIGDTPRSSVYLLNREGGNVA